MALKSTVPEREAAGNRYYKASGFTTIKAFFANFVNFHGRSSQGEYWWIMLFEAIVAIIAFIGMFVALASVLLGAGQHGNETVFALLAKHAPGMIIFLLLVLLAALVLLVPSIAIIIRRYRDAGFPWWVYLIQIVLCWVLFMFFPANTSGGRIISLLFNLSVAVLCLFPSKPLPVSGDREEDLDERIQPDVFSANDKSDQE